jgi:hypothetical protein
MAVHSRGVREAEAVEVKFDPAIQRFLENPLFHFNQPTKLLRDMIERSLRAKHFVTFKEYCLPSETLERLKELLPDMQKVMFLCMYCSIPLNCFLLNKENFGCFLRPHDPEFKFPKLKEIKTIKLAYLHLDGSVYEIDALDQYARPRYAGT